MEPARPSADDVRREAPCRCAANRVPAPLLRRGRPGLPGRLDPDVLARLRLHAIAVSSVLAAFTAGLALGSWVIGRLIDRRTDEIRIQGLLEIGVGISGLLLLPALDWVGDAFIAIYRARKPSFFSMSLIRAGFSFLLLIVSTAFMGGTLPAPVR